jgi:hypothetical protein
MIAAELMVLAFVLSTMNNHSSAEAPPARAALAHVRNSFHFLIHAPLRIAAPLFGPEGERSWAGAEWDPQFLYPRPAEDVQGAVFTVQQGNRKSVWVTTQFDVERGRMQYVSIVPGIRASTVDVRLAAVDASTTSVEVTYVRTALDGSANEEVEALGQSDRQQGPDWQEAIETYLGRQRDRKH